MSLFSKHVVTIAKQDKIIITDKREQHGLWSYYYHMYINLMAISNLTKPKVNWQNIKMYLLAALLNQLSFRQYPVIIIKPLQVPTGMRPTNTKVCTLIFLHPKRHVWTQRSSHIGIWTSVRILGKIRLCILQAHTWNLGPHPICISPGQILYNNWLIWWLLPWSYNQLELHMITYHRTFSKVKIAI